MPGLVQELIVESDNREQLEWAVKILLCWDSKVSHYTTGVDVHGTPFLTMRWHETGGATPLMAPMSDASSIADQCYAWLKNVEYPEEPDHDGSNSRGWRVTNRVHKIATEGYDQFGPNGFYVVFTIYPAWVEYHK